MLTMVITSVSFSLVNSTNSTLIVTIPALLWVNILISFLREECVDFMTGKAVNINKKNFSNF